MIGKMIRKKKPRLKISGYSLYYTDKKSGNRKEGVIYSRLLSSEKYGLVGKPDYVFKRGRAMIPVELKSGSVGNSNIPREGDLMQLTAYFIIIHDEFGVKPRQGRLIYNDCMFVVRNSRRLRNRLLRTVNDMRFSLENNGKNLPEANKEYMKCRYCVCRETVCGTDDD